MGLERGFAGAAGPGFGRSRAGAGRRLGMRRSRGAGSFLRGIMIQSFLSELRSDSFVNISFQSFRRRSDTFLSNSGLST